jgi:glycosyltransferase involved in cell wall biosynthesis
LKVDEVNKIKNRPVWVINSNRWNSAISDYSLKIALALNDVFDVVYSPLRGSPAEKRALQLGLKVIPIESFRLDEYDKFKHLKQNIDPYFIFTTGGKETTLLSLVKKTKYETRIRFRGDHLKSGLFRNLTFKFSHRNFDGFLTPCDLIKSQIRKLSRKKSRSIDLAVLDNQFNFEPDSVLSPKRLLIFGRFDPVKGHKEFMNIFREHLLVTPDDDTELHIYGREENISLSELRAEAEKNKISEKVVFKVGTIEDVPGEMRKATLGIVSSLGSELICRVAHEFLMCGTPVFVSGAGATEEVIKSPSFGLSYKELSDKDAAKMLDNLLKKTQSSEYKKDLANEAKQYFSLQSMRSELVHFLEDLSIFAV